MIKKLLFLGFIALLGAPAAGVFQSPDADKLAAILQKARDYCLRLDKAALDFVCQEQVEQEVNSSTKPSLTSASPLPPSAGGRAIGRTFQPAPIDIFKKTKLIYDYQFVRKGTEVKERRDLLEKNGDKVNKADVAPETKHFKLRDILFGASSLLGAGAKLSLEYKLVSEEKIRGDYVAIISCVPLPALTGRVLSGRATVRVKDGAVLRIDWCRLSH